jgi:DNA-binding IclR family transcriptional regulator
VPKRGTDFRERGACVRAALLCPIVPVGSHQLCDILDVVRFDVDHRDARGRKLLRHLDLFATQLRGDPGRYYLGIRLFMWSTAAGERFAISRNIGAALDSLAQKTEETIYLMMRNGADAVCLDRREGSFPIRTLTLRVGDRRPLGIGAGSMAILASMPQADIERALEVGMAERARYGIADRDLYKMMATARQRGYAFYNGQIIPNMSAVGVPLFDIHGTAIASLSVAALSERLAPARRDKVTKLLQQEAAAFTERLKQASTMGRA